MNDYIKYIINGMMCIAGGILAAVFLVSDRWMRDPNVYSEELGRSSIALILDFTGLR